VQTLFSVYYCQCCPRKIKKEKKVLQPSGVSKSVAHALLACLNVGLVGNVGIQLRYFITPSLFCKLFPTFSLLSVGSSMYFIL
jgi:hypothetical protein